METFSLTVQRVQGGGYIAWCLINGQAATEPAQPHAARSTLHEIVQMTAIPLIEQHFKDKAILYQTTLPPIDDGIVFPNVTRPERPHNGGEHGLMDRLRSASITMLPAAWAFVPFLALTSLA